MSDYYELVKVARKFRTLNAIDRLIGIADKGRQDSYVLDFLLNHPDASLSGYGEVWTLRCDGFVGVGETKAKAVENWYLTRRV